MNHLVGNLARWTAVAALRTLLGGCGSMKVTTDWDRQASFDRVFADFPPPRGD